MEKRRNPLTDGLHLWTETFALPITKIRLQSELASNRKEPQTDSVPTILIPGALGSENDLKLTKEWFLKLGGLKQVDIVNPLPKDKVLKQVEHLVSVIKNYKNPVRLVGFSLGGLVAYLAALECLERGIAVERVIAVDSPLLPITKSDFNHWATLYSVNDLLKDKRINNLLLGKKPDSLRLISLYTPNSGIINPDVSRRKDADSFQLPTQSHMSIYYDINVLNSIKNVFHN
ncbi:MAG TPA: thioesterase domain-containing protein [Patescibacteria group bacterium]